MKKLSFILISLLIGIGFVLISLELFLRLNPKFGYNYSSYNFKNEKVMALNNRNFGYIRPSALLGYEIIPDCHDIYLSESSNSSSNSYGLIGKEYKLKKENNTFRILLLGDSIAFQNLSNKFLEENLNNNSLLNSKYKFEIWNASVPSYDVRRYYLYLKYKGLNFKPDMVIIYLFMNDFFLNVNIYYKNQAGFTEYYFPIAEISKRYTINPFLMKHSYLYRLIILRLDSYLLSKKKTQGADNLEQNGRSYLQMIKEICEKNKIPLLIVIFPYLKPLDEYKDYQIKEYKAICKAIKDLKIDHLNLYELLSKIDLYSLRGKKEDEMHPSREGHRLFTKIIYNYLLDNFFTK